MFEMVHIRRSQGKFIEVPGTYDAHTKRHVRKSLAYTFLLFLPLASVETML